VIFANADGIGNELFTDWGAVTNGFNVRPVVIAPLIPEIIVKPGVDNGGDLIFNQGPGDADGGLVNIDRILHDDESFESGRKALVILVDDTSNQSDAPAASPDIDTRSLVLSADPDAESGSRTTSTKAVAIPISLDKASAELMPRLKDSAIAGEWARAAVFEMAGGEPAWIRPAVTSDKIKALAPADRQESPRADVPLSPVAAQQAALRTSGSRIRLIGNQVEFTLPLDNWAGWKSGATSSTVSQFAGGEGGPPRDGFAAFNVADMAVAEVFNELGGSKQQPVRGSFEDDTRSGPLVAGSVIVLLMLERAAARYKARNERQNLAVVAGPPRIERISRC
jgi:hypothetical protein